MEDQNEDEDNIKLSDTETKDLVWLLISFRDKPDITFKLRKPTKKVSYKSTVNYLHNLIKTSQVNQIYGSAAMYYFVHYRIYGPDIWFIPSLETGKDMPAVKWLRQYGQE